MSFFSLVKHLQLLLELADPAVIEFLTRLKEDGIALPTLGYELEMNQQVVATAEAAWPDCKVALIHQDMQEDMATFTEQGWLVAPYSEDGPAPDDLDAFKSKLTKS